MPRKIVAGVLMLIVGLSCLQGQAFSVDRDPLDLFKAQVSPNLEAGRKAVEAKDFTSAIQHLTKAASETPHDADVHNLLGYSYRHLRQFDMAHEHYRLALEIDPRHRGAHEYIGELYLEMGQLANAEKHLTLLYSACPWFGKCPEYDDLKEAIEKYKAKGQAKQ